MNQSYDDFFCKRIFSLCEKNGLSEASLSQAIDTSDSYIRLVLAGKSRMSLNKFFKMCDVLKITPMEFFLPCEAPVESRKILEIIETASREDKILFTKLLERLYECKRTNNESSGL